MRSWSRVGYSSGKSKNFLDDEPVMHCGSHVVSGNFEPGNAGQVTADGDPEADPMAGYGGKWSVF
jgi:hypothetical protein